MDNQAQGRLGDIFPRVEVLPLTVRLQLCELLAAPGSMPAVLTTEMADLGLPRTDNTRQALRLAIEKGLAPSSLAQLRRLPLVDIVPAVRTLEGGPLAPVRLIELLERESATTWAELGTRELREMARWKGMGPQALAGLIGAAVEAVLDASSAAADEEVEDQAEEAGPGSAALALLLQHDQTSGGKLRVAFEAQASGDGPAEVRATAARLLAAADRAGDPRVALLDRVWMTAGDHRQRAVFAHRALQLGDRTPTKELATALGLSDNRVLQVESEAKERLRGAVKEPLRALVVTLGERLGTACRLTAVDEALATLGLPPRTDPRSALLIWLAGPYLAVKDHTGWVATDPAALLADTRRLLSDDGGVRQLDHVVADLDAAGIAAHDIDAWLAEHSSVVVVDGLVVDLSGSPADVAERLLSATGRAMTAADLAPLAPPAHTAAAIDRHLRRDRRFVRVDRHRFELAEWGGEAYIELPPPPPTELFPRTGRSQLRIEVDAAVLRGASEPVPRTVVDALGLPCGGLRTFTTRYGPVALSHKAPQPTRGSIRPVALALGATEGDVLVVEFDAATGDASVELVVASSSAAS